MTFTYQVLLQDIQRYWVFWFLTQSTYNLKKKDNKSFIFKAGFFCKKNQTNIQTDRHSFDTFVSNESNKKSYNLITGKYSHAYLID